MAPEINNCPWNMMDFKKHNGGVAEKMVNKFCYSEPQCFFALFLIWLNFVENNHMENLPQVSEKKWELFNHVQEEKWLGPFKNLNKFLGVLWTVSPS